VFSFKILFHYKECFTNLMSECALFGDQQTSNSLLLVFIMTPPFLKLVFFSRILTVGWLQILPPHVALIPFLHWTPCLRWAFCCCFSFSRRGLLMIPANFQIRYNQPKRKTCADRMVLSFCEKAPGHLENELFMKKKKLQYAIPMSIVHQKSNG